VAHKEMIRDRRRAYRVVDDFEDELADYTGAPYAVAVDSCSNALYLALKYNNLDSHSPVALLPKRTYVGVWQAALNAGYMVEWSDCKWEHWYAIPQTGIVDCARMLPSRHRSWPWTPQGHWNAICLSFHAAKQLPLGRGGAILTDDKDAAKWFRAARMDGRPPGAPIEATQFPGFHCPMPPDVAARGLWILSRWNDAGYSPPPLPLETYPDLSLL
jgi:dTDP-4-amino-4,6-dideoxygalactose transaminase